LIGSTLPTALSSTGMSLRTALTTVTGAGGATCGVVSREHAARATHKSDAAPIPASDTRGNARLDMQFGSLNG
jgi:hypothetical protein